MLDERGGVEGRTVGGKTQGGKTHGSLSEWLVHEMGVVAGGWLGHARKTAGEGFVRRFDRGHRV